MHTKPHIQVGVALIIRDGRCLISQRKPHVHLGGLWEFPGGKCEAGESLEDCTRREVSEELGVEIHQLVYVMTHYHEYSEKSVDLVVFDCSIIRGEPVAIDCADFRWVKPEHLCEFEFPPADAPIISVLLQRMSDRCE